jgi:hypothetical protein
MAMIAVVETTDDHGNVVGHDMWIDFLNWDIQVSVMESHNEEDITIFDHATGEDVTEEFCAFDDRNELGKIIPSGQNLYQLMNLLRTNYEKGGKDG